MPFQAYCRFVAWVLASGDDPSERVFALPSSTSLQLFSAAVRAVLGA